MISQNYNLLSQVLEAVSATANELSGLGYLKHENNWVK